MKTIEAHANQICEYDNTLRFDDIEIRGEIHGPYFKAISATEIVLDDDGEVTETPLSVKSVLPEWMAPMNVAHTVNGLIAVLCSDNTWRPLVYKDGDEYKGVFKK